MSCNNAKISHNYTEYKKLFEALRRLDIFVFVLNFHTLTASSIMAIYEMKNCKLLGGTETKQALNQFLCHCSFKGMGFAVFFLAAAFGISA